MRTLRRAAQNAWQTKPYSNRECTSTYRLTAWAWVASGRMRAVRSAREGSIAASTEKERRPSFDVCQAHPQPLVKPVELSGWERGIGKGWLCVAHGGPNVLALDAGEG